MSYDITREEAPQFASLRISRNNAIVAMNQAISRMKRAGASTEDIVRVLSVSPSRVIKTKAGS